MVQYMEDAERVTTEHASTRGAPWHLWAVGGVSLLWNSVGITDYTLSQLRNRDWLGAAADNMGIGVDDMIAYIDGFPAWMHGFWAIGVWGAFIGSILLLFRRRLAVWVFAASLLGLAVTQFYRAFTPQPDWVQGDLVFNLILWSIATFLLIYAVSMRNKGVLR